MQTESHPRLSDAIQWLQELTAFDTIPTHSNIPLVRHLEERLGAQDIATTTALTPNGDKATFLATIGPNIDGGVVLSGHTDVVDVAGQDWDTPPFSLSEKNGRLYARGACDMKGFLACALAMAPLFAQTPLTRPVYLAFSRDEEIGCAGSADMLALIKQCGANPDVALIGEPTRMKTIVGHKAGLTSSTVFHGVAAHSSMPAEGQSAIPFAARFITHLDNLEKEMARQADATSPFSPPHGTINVGMVHGGTALNIFAARCEMNWHYRAMPDEDLDAFVDRINDFLQNTLLPDMRASGHAVAIENTVNTCYPALAPLPDSPALALVAELIGDVSDDAVSFGTEAGHFQQASIPAVVIGPGDIAQAHKPNEYIEISQLAQCLHFFDKLRSKLSA